MNFLQLCQAVARESGTVSGVAPSTVTGQQGRLEKIVKWTAEAWRFIQVQRTDWLWMQQEFTGDTVIGQRRYTPASWAIDARFGEWIYKSPRDTVTIYVLADGPAAEGDLLWMPWWDWRRIYDRGIQNANPPSDFSISPAREFCLGPVPDAVYRLRGVYRKSAQILVADDDVPECHEDHHMAIVWKAIILLGEHDEAPVPVTTASQKLKAEIGNMVKRQTPDLEMWGAPLA